MTFKAILRVAGLLVLPALCAPLTHATLLMFTNVSDFNAAIGSGFQTPHIADFESAAGGTTIASGSSFEGVTFTYNIGGGAFDMQVGSTFDTTSGTNYLGTTGDDAFLSGDSFTMTFASAVHAVGLFVISGGFNYAGDYTLGVAQGSVSNADALDSTFGALGDGGSVFFLGLVETDSSLSFTSAEFSSLDGFGIPFNIDDIVTASAADGSVPDTASSLGLLAGACAGLLAFRRRRP